MKHSDANYKIPNKSEFSGIRGINRLSAAIQSFLIILLSGYLWSGCGNHQDPEKLNLLLIVIDTCRGDALYASGQNEALTPNLDRLCRKGALFENFTVNTPHTVPSHCSLLTGLIPAVHKVRSTGGTALSDNAVTLAERLNEQNYDCRAFVSASVLNKNYGFSQGFDFYDEVLPQQNEGVHSTWMSIEGRPVNVLFHERSSIETNRRVFQSLHSNPVESPFFIWVHYFDPHFPYFPLPPYGLRFDNPYDGEIAATDKALGMLLHRFLELGLLDDTIIVVTSDHGESLGEHGEQEHGLLLFNSTIKTFLILNGPGIPQNRIISDPYGQTDVMPLLLNLLEINSPTVSGFNPFDGRTRTDKELIRASYSETMDPVNRYGWSPLITLTENNWKYIHAPLPELYDLATDPAERHPVKGYENIKQKMAGEVDSFLKLNEDSSGFVEIQDLSSQQIAQLEKLGYVASTKPAEMSFDGGNPMSLIMAHYYHSEAQKALSQGAGQSAEAFFEKALEIDPENAEILSEFGGALLRLGKVREAQKILEKSLEIDPLHFNALLRLGHCAYKLDHSRLAENYYRKLLEIIPNHAEGHFSLAVVYAERAEYDAAEMHFHKALELETNERSLLHQKALSALTRIQKEKS